MMTSSSTSISSYYMRCTTSIRPRRTNRSSSTARPTMTSAAAMACVVLSCLILVNTFSTIITSSIFDLHTFSAEAATHHSSQPTLSPRQKRPRDGEQVPSLNAGEEVPSKRGVLHRPKDDNIIYSHDDGIRQSRRGSRNLRNAQYDKTGTHNNANDANPDYPRHQEQQQEQNNGRESEFEHLNNNSDESDYTSVVQIDDYPITTSFAKSSNFNPNSISNSNRNLQQQTQYQQSQQQIVTKTHLSPSTSCNPQTQQPFSFHFQTDGYGSETSWYLHEQSSLIHNGGTIGKYLGHGPPSGYQYGDLTIYTYSYCLEIGKVYVLGVEDNFGDGMCCDRGYGGYELVIGGVRVYSTEYGDTFNEFAEHVFEVREGLYTTSSPSSRIPVASNTSSPSRSPVASTSPATTLVPTTLKEPACEWSNPETCGCAQVNQADYRGTLSVTESGYECMDWSSQSVHVHPYLPESFPGANLIGNYCRNPNGNNDPRPWCYTTDPNKRWDYCTVPTCSEETSAISAAPQSLTPTISPIVAPTASPIVPPTASPILPTQTPSFLPSSLPSNHPTMPPTRHPTSKPTNGYHIYNPSNGCYGGDVHVRVQVQADEFSTDTSWEIYAPNGTKVLHEVAGSFAAYETRSQEMCLPHGLYTFSIYDVYGDGICCRYGEGYYRIYLDGNEVLHGGVFTKMETEQLNIGFDPLGYMSEREVQYLEAHNTRRKAWHERYNQSYVPLRYSPALAESSKAWAEELLYTCGIVGIQHENVNMFGENLAKNTGANGWGQLYPPDNIVRRWVEFEVGLPYPSNGHLTQVLWRGSKYLGCGESVKPWRDGFCRVQVCRYGRAGNCNMKLFNSTEGQNWLPPMLEQYSKCGPGCPPEGCF